MSKKVSARKDETNIISSTGPDVCLTPIGGVLVPVAYFSVAFLNTSIRTASSVFDNHREDFNLNSRAYTSTGHEPGTGKGIKIPGYKGMAQVKVASGDVYTNGFAQARHGDPAWINRPGPGPQEPQMAERIINVKTNLKVV